MKSDKELVAFAVSYYASDRTIDDLVTIGGDLSMDEINRMMQLSQELEELLDRGGDAVKGIQKHLREQYERSGERITIGDLLFHYEKTGNVSKYHALDCWLRQYEIDENTLRSMRS